MWKERGIYGLFSKSGSRGYPPLTLFAGHTYGPRPAVPLFCTTVPKIPQTVFRPPCAFFFVFNVALRPKKPCGLLGTAISTFTQLLSSDTQVLSSDTQVLSSDTQVLSSDTQVMSSDTQVLSSDTQVLSSDTQVLSSDSQLLTSDTQLLTSDSQLLTSQLAPSGGLLLKCLCQGRQCCRCAFVQNYDTYWVNVTSTPLKATNYPPSNHTTATTPPGDTTAPSVSHLRQRGGYKRDCGEWGLHVPNNDVKINVKGGSYTCGKANRNV